MNADEMFDKIPANVPQSIKEFIVDFIKQILNEYETKINKIYLYGFYISGNFNKISEIDLIIVIDAEDYSEYKRIKNYIGEMEYNQEEKYEFNWYFDIVFDTLDNKNNKQSVILYEK